MGRKVDDDDSTPGQIDPLRHISKAPPPITPVRGSVAVVPPKRIVDFVPRGPRGFATYANAPAILAMNAADWRIPPERLPAKTDMEAHARLIEDGLAAMNERAAGIDKYNGHLVWAPAATWRTSGFLHGRQVGASVLALHGKVVRFPGKYGHFSCYPILACRTLALIFGAKKPPEAPPQDVLKGIQDIEKPARPGRPPTKPDDDFEPLAPARPSLADPFGASAAQRKWDDDPANKDEGDFWWDVGCRYFELKMREDELKVVPAVGMQAVAARNHEHRLIKAERVALKGDEREVRLAAPTELGVTIERVRRRWDKRDSIAAGLIAAEQVQEPEASADLPEPAIADGVVETAEPSNTVAVPPKMPSDADLDSCITASAAGSKDGKTSGRQLRTDAPTWFAKNHIRPVTQADMERRLNNKNNATLRRGTGKRRG
jgi:hypothetical protein